MGRKVWVPVVSGPLAPYAAGFGSWLASRAYSGSTAADRLYQFDQLSRWLAREGLGVGEMTGERAERFALERRTAAVVSWASPQSVALPLEYLRQLGAVPPPVPACPARPLEELLADYGRYLSVERGLCEHTVLDAYLPAARLFLHYADLTDGSRLVTLLSKIQPDEVYNLAAQSHVRVSFDEPEHTGDTTGIGAMRLLEAVRMAGLNCRYYQASSSEMFGATPPPQDEDTPFYPRSPYGAAKVYAYWVTKNYREGYGMFAVNGILFNHESPRRGETFVTRKVTRAVARIQAGLDDYVYMGNLDSIRDWGYAPEYVEGMWRMLQADEPEDFVLATGGNFTVRDFVVTAFEHAGLDWEKHVKFDERYLRPTEVDALVGDASKAERLLGWKPSVQTDELARIMVDADIEALKHEGTHWIDQPRLADWPTFGPTA